MIGSRGFELPADSFDLSFRKPPLGERNHDPILIGIGDERCGPHIGLFFDAPSTAEEFAAGTDLTPAHGHPTDNFRIVMKGELWVGRERYHHGEFRLQRAGRPYGADGDAPHEEGNWRIISFADRRGSRVRPTNPEMRARVESADALEVMRERYGIPEILPPDHPGVDGLVTTIDKQWSRLGHIDADFHEADSWIGLDNGVHMAVSLMGVHDVGPIWILQRTPPGATATPAMALDSDVFRCVIAGSHQRGGEVVEMGDARFQSAGVPWEAVQAGPDGLDEVICIGDRTGMPVRATGSDEVGWAQRLTEIVATLARDLAALPPAPGRE